MSKVVFGEIFHLVVYSLKSVPFNLLFQLENSITVKMEKKSPLPALALYREPSAIKIGRALEKTAFWGMLATIFLTAFPYGTVDPFFRFLFVAASSFFAFCRVIETLLTNRPLRYGNQSILIPACGILILAACQLIALPGAQGARPLSLDPFETQTFILNFIGLLLCWETLMCYAAAPPRRLQALISLVIIIGCGSALFGFARYAFFSGENNFLQPIFNEKVQYAQFVNRNHFCFLMEMTAGLLLGLLLCARLKSWQKLAGWSAIGIICLSVILANSRGGILSLVGLGLFAALLYFFAPKPKAKDAAEKSSKFVIGRLKNALSALIAVSLIFGMALFTIAFVGGDAVADRIETIQSEVRENEVGKVRRREIWSSTWELIKEKPVAGAGFGAYQAAITRHDRSSGQMSLQQAHNDYLEILANGGILALIFALIFFILLARAVLKQLSARDRFGRAACFGAVTGIFGVLLHSVVDFGLHVFVNALVFIILTVIATAKLENRRSV